MGRRVPPLILFPLLAGLPCASPVVATSFPDPTAVTQALTDLDHLSEVDSDISCIAPAMRAHQLMCASEDLWQMGLLDARAWVFAIENATGVAFDLGDPPLDEWFIARRDACADEACLRNLLIRHTNDSLGGMSPYSD